jgi:hypothetical protein
MIMNLILSMTLALNLFALPGDSCQTAINLPTLPFNDHLSTAPYSSALNLSDPCIQHGTLGHDIIYTYTNDLPVPCTVAVMAVPIGFWNVAIYVLDECDPPSCVRGNDFFGPGAPETLTVALQPGEMYYFVIDGRGANDYGIVSYSFSECLNQTGVKEESSGLHPFSRTALEVVPNPTTGEADFRFSLTAGSEVDLSVFDRSGRLVYSVESSVWTAGDHSIRWSGQDDNGMDVKPGIYFVKLRADDAEAIRSFVLLR